jgi:response regulator RpfG family c-di-GMP phosphodiesterase
LLLNPFLSEEDLFRTILQDLGVVSKRERRVGRQPSKQELVNTLHDFLLSLIPLRARALLTVDVAQNLPLPVLEQIRILSNVETDKEKPLQIILVGQLNLMPLLRSPGLRQLDQRVSIRYAMAVRVSEPQLSDIERAALLHNLGRLAPPGANEIAVAAPERYDGSGFPRGLKGEAIPIGARIIAVADVWDELVSGIGDTPVAPAHALEIMSVDRLAQ